MKFTAVDGDGTTCSSSQFRDSIITRMASDLVWPFVFAHRSKRANRILRQMRKPAAMPADNGLNGARALGREAQELSSRLEQFLRSL
jgi:hypothetical protein